MLFGALLALGSLVWAQAISRQLALLIDREKVEAKALFLDGRLYLPLEAAPQLALAVTLKGEAVYIARTNQPRCSGGVWSQQYGGLSPPGQIKGVASSVIDSSVPLFFKTTALLDEQLGKVSYSTVNRIKAEGTVRSAVQNASSRYYDWVKIPDLQGKSWAELGANCQMLFLY